MSDQEQDSPLPTWLGRGDIWLAMISGAVLAFMMVFVCLGVVMRYGFAAPMAGANEVLELASVTFVMFALAYCTCTDGHIRVDLIEGLLGPKGIAFTDLIYRVLGIVALWFLVKSTIARMFDAREFEDVTNMIQLPLWPFYGLVALGMGIYGVILAVQIFATLFGLGRADD